MHKPTYANDLSRSQSPAKSDDRVVVTGLGAVTSIGIGLVVRLRRTLARGILEESYCR